MTKNIEGKQFSGGMLNDDLSGSKRKKADQHNQESLDAGLAWVHKNISDSPELVADIRDEFFRYLLIKKYSDTAPSPRLMIDHLQKIANASTELRKYLELIPLSATALVDEVFWRTRGELFSSTEERLKADLVTLDAVVNEVVGKIEPWVGSSGRKSNFLQIRFLATVAEIIDKRAPGKFGLINLAGTAANLLQVLGVRGIPLDPEKAREAIRTHSGDVKP